MKQIVLLITSFAFLMFLTGCNEGSEIDEFSQEDVIIEYDIIDNDLMFRLEGETDWREVVDLSEEGFGDQNFFYVEFLDWDNQIIDGQIVKKGEEAIAPSTPERNGYSFIGWDKTFDVVKEELTIRAVYARGESLYQDDSRFHPRSGIQAHFIEADPSKGYHIPYFIYIPSTEYEGINQGADQYLMLEALNNNIIGNDFSTMFYENLVSGKNTHVVTNITEELFIPKVIPYLPKTCFYIEEDSSRDYGHFHALDSTVISLEEHLDEMIECSFSGDDGGYLGLDYLESLVDIEKQIHAIVLDAQERLNASGWNLEEEIFVAGFSASGSFADRYTSIYPEQVKAMFAGGLFIPTLPVNTYQGVDLIYQLGVGEHEDLFGRGLDIDEYNAIPKIYYMGALETIDAVMGTDTYTDKHREIIFQLYGEDGINERWKNAQDAYHIVGGDALFLTDKTMGHSVSSEVTEYIVNFFRLNRDSNTAIYDLELIGPSLIMNYNGHVLEDETYEVDPNVFIQLGQLTIFGAREPSEYFADYFNSRFSRSTKTNRLSDDAINSEYLVFLVEPSTVFVGNLDFMSLFESSDEGIYYYQKGIQKVIYIQAESSSALMAMLEDLPSNLFDYDFSQAQVVE